MQNSKAYSNLTKPMKYPVDLKLFIYGKTDYLSNKTIKVSRFVSYMQMYEGKPLERIFGFKASSKKRRMQDMLVKEVARNYDHKQWLGDVRSSAICGYKYPEYKLKKDSFALFKGKWSFYCYSMTDPTQFLKDNNIKYSGWDSKIDVSFLDYLTNYLDNPKCELLSKAGLSYWTNYLRYLDTTKKSLHEVFKIKQKCVPLLKDEQFRFRQLMICRKYGYTTIEEIETRLAIIYICNKNNWYYMDKHMIEIMKNDETYKYLVNNKFYLRYGLNEYIDYLKGLMKIGAISDHKALYPKQFKSAHKKVMKKIELQESEKYQSGFTKAYKKHKKYEFKDDKLMIIVVKTPEDLYHESEVLEHCVRTYDEDISKGRTEIMFIRKCSDPKRPYYTLEIKKQKVIQVRGKENIDPKKDVIDFVRKWAKKYKIKYQPEKQISFGA